MTINQNRISKCLKFENGCGLHALIDCLIANLRNGNLDPNKNPELRKALVELHENCKKLNTAPGGFMPNFNCEFEKFVEYLKWLKENNKPVEATQALSRAMRQMLHNPALRQPFVSVPDEDILKLGNRFNIQVESYSVIEIWCKRQLASKGIKNPTNEIIQRVIATMAKAELFQERAALRNSNPLTEIEIQQRIVEMQARYADVDQLETVPQEGLKKIPGKEKYVRLKLFNRDGDHWERECNDEDTAEENRLAWERHNKAIDSFEAANKAAEDNANEETTRQMLAEDREAEEREKAERRRRGLAVAQAAQAKQNVQAEQAKQAEQMKKAEQAARTSAAQSAGLAGSNAKAIPNASTQQRASGQSASTQQTALGQSASAQQGSIFTPLQTIFKAIGDHLETTSGGYGLFHFISLFVKWFAEIFEFLANGVNLARQMKLPELFENLSSGSGSADELQGQPLGSSPGPKPGSPSSDPSCGNHTKAFNQTGNTGSRASFTPGFNTAQSRNGSGNDCKPKNPVPSASIASKIDSAAKTNPASKTEPQPQGSKPKPTQL